MKADYYVYVLFRETGAPFYVGKGRAKRIDIHERQSRRLLDGHRDRIVRKAVAALGSLPAVTVRAGLTDAEAKATEVALIAAIGREPSGPLVNQTAGGDGVPELPPETRARIAAGSKAALTGRARPADVIARITATKRAQAKPPKPKPIRPRADPEVTKAKIAAARVGRKCSPETRAKISAALTGKTLSAETRAKVSANNSGRTEAGRKALSKGAARRWANPAERERYREIGRKAAAARWGASR